MVTGHLNRTSIADKLYGLFYASLVATAMFATFDTAAAALAAGAAPDAAGYYWVLLFLYLWIGGLISLVVVFLIGMPLWIYSESKGYHTLRHALIIGAATGGVLSLACLFLLLGNPVWLVIRMAWTIATGAVAGLVARVVAGPFSPPAGTPDSPVSTHTPPPR